MKSLGKMSNKLSLNPFLNYYLAQCHHKPQVTCTRQVWPSF